VLPACSTRHHRLAWSRALRPETSGCADFRSHRGGAIAYLNRQLKSVSIAGIIIFVIIAVTMKVTTAIGFLVRAVSSYLAGYIGMRCRSLPTCASEAARKGLNAALRLAFRGGSVTGMIVAGLALTAVAGYYTIRPRWVFPAVTRWSPWWPWVSAAA
jgi:Na+/H+-translocating membrane pyrophosphatase